MRHFYVLSTQTSFSLELLGALHGRLVKKLCWCISEFIFTEKGQGN